MSTHVTRIQEPLLRREGPSGADAEELDFIVRRFMKVCLRPQSSHRLPIRNYILEPNARLKIPTSLSRDTSS